MRTARERANAGMTEIKMTEVERTHLLSSPAVCGSFVAGRKNDLEELKQGTLYRPYATSLRMGRLGYQSDAQATLAVSYNSLESYANSLHGALTQPYPAYEAVGIRNPGGDYNQLATSLLQIENEFYGLIRPKRVIYPGERPLHALRERGVEYIEVRCMDLDPFEPVGINASTTRFIDIFLLHCLLADSPPDSAAEIAALGRNQHRTAENGRQPGLLLEQGEQEILLTDWAAQLLGECGAIAEALDAALSGTHGGTPYAQALDQARAVLARPEALPSARALGVMAAEFDNSYPRFIRAQSASSRAHLLGLPWTEAQAMRYGAMADDSVAEQRRIEAADSMLFEPYRQAYLSPERLRA